jgi:hypothetical protein
VAIKRRRDRDQTRGRRNLPNSALLLDQLVLFDDRLKVQGRLSTHVLDTHAGGPAPGIAIELVELAERGHEG